MASPDSRIPSVAIGPYCWPLIFIAITQVLVPALLAFRSGPLGEWPGATLFVAQLACLSYTSTVLAVRLGSACKAETALMAFTIFLCLPAATVAYLGLAGVLFFSVLSSTVGVLEISLLSLTRTCTAAFPKAKDYSSSLTFRERLLVWSSVLGFGVMALNAVRYTPRDSDSLWYHLPELAEWIKTHSIAPAASIPLIAKAYPGAREAILTWLSFPMTSENLALLFLLEVPGILVALYAISRHFNVSRTASLATAALFLTTPEISMWAGSQKNDLFLALAFSLTLFFMLLWLNTGLERYAVVAGLAGGLLCATKLSGPSYAFLLLALLGGAFMLKNKTPSAETSAHWYRGLLLMLLTVVVMAAPWYLRNLYYFRNPLYPQKVTLLGKTVFEGPLDHHFFAPLTLGFDFARLFGFWRRFTEGLGVALPLLLAGPLLILLVWYWPQYKKQRDALLWVVLLPVLLLLLYMQQPFSLQAAGVGTWEVQPRFLFSFVVCLHISLGFLLSMDSRFLRLGFPLILLGILGNLARWTHFWWLLASLAILAALLTPCLANWPGILKALGYFTQRRLAAGILVFIASVAASHWLDNFREGRKDDPQYGYTDISEGFSQICSYVRHNISSERLLCLGRPEKFPFYGRGYTNTLYSCDGCDILQTIQQEHIKYVVGIKPFERHGELMVYGPPVTRSLREKHPDKFRLLYSFEGAEVLKVLE